MRLLESCGGDKAETALLQESGDPFGFEES
jgi:hypothetical protein